MVLDNADDLEMFFPEPLSDSTGSECNPTLREYLPPSSKGSMLITTRDERVGKRLASMHTLIVVNPMSPQEAHDLLGKWQTKRLDRSDPDHSKQLLEALGYIPLAITQAAAFISENHITLRKYLEIFHTSDSDVQDLLNSDIKDSRRDLQSYDSVIKTWKISFDLIKEQKPRAAEMLSLMAVLDRQGIPESLLRDDADTNVGFTTALGTLQAFSLISVGADGATYELHRLVQLATRKWLEMQDKITSWQEKALSAVANMFPEGVFENWTTCESLLPHAQTVIQYGYTNGICSPEFPHLLSNLAIFDQEQGRYEIACVKILAAIDIRKRILGLEHPETLVSMNIMAIAYFRVDRLEDAEKLHVQILEARKRVLGAEHPNTLSSMNNLATTYRDQYRWEEAEKLQMQVLKARKRVLGAEHPNTLMSMDNLAGIYQQQQQQHRREEAENLQVQVLRTRKRVLRAEHPDTLASMNNLANTYLEQYRWKEAEELHVQVLETRKRVLGLKHPHTLSSMNNLAFTYQKQSRFEEAEKLYVQILETRKRMLGTEHSTILMSMNNLAVLYSKQNRHGEAIALMESVVELRTKKLGANHPDTINSGKRLQMWVDA